MAEHEILGDALERLEWDEQRSPRPTSKLAQFTRRSALTGGAAGLAAVMLEACGGSSAHPGTATASSGSGAASGVFGSSQSLRFTMVNHVTSNSVFVPTQNGAADACTLLGCSYQWTGSQTSDATQMIDEINAAVSERVDGIATTLIDPTEFDTPVQNALDAGIPVVSYNADVPGNARLAYIGQDLYASGQELGRQIASAMPIGGDIAIFAATPGSSNLKPRIEGALDTLRSRHGIMVKQVASSASESQELTLIETFIEAHPTYMGFFAVDGGSTAAVAQAIQKYNLKKRAIVGGGFDLNPTTQKLLSDRQIEFSIDQQPYLQGFMAILQLYLYSVSDKLTGTARLDTGIKVVDHSSVASYVDTTSRFEGTGSGAGVGKAS